LNSRECSAPNIDPEFRNWWQIRKLDVEHGMLDVVLS